MDSAGGSERLDADLFDLGAVGARGSAHGRAYNGKARHARGSSPRLGDDPPWWWCGGPLVLSACWLSMRTPDTSNATLILPVYDPENPSIHTLARCVLYAFHVTTFR